MTRGAACSRLCAARSLSAGGRRLPQGPLLHQHLQRPEQALLKRSASPAVLHPSAADLSDRAGLMPTSLPIAAPLAADTSLRNCLPPKEPPCNFVSSRPCALRGHLLLSSCPLPALLHCFATCLSGLWRCLPRPSPSALPKHDHRFFSAASWRLSLDSPAGARTPPPPLCWLSAATLNVGGHPRANLGKPKLQGGGTVKRWWLEVYSAQLAVAAGRLTSQFEMVEQESSSRKRWARNSEAVQREGRSVYKA